MILSSRSPELLVRSCGLVLAGNILLRFALAALLPITYKEAYFWEWSHYLSWGYLDHPPMVAWIIRASATLFPQYTVLTVRIGSLVLGIASLLLIYRLAHRLFDSRDVARRALLIAASIPLLNAVWTLMLPDTPLIFFQLLSLNILISVGENNRSWTCPLLGLLVGMAFLSTLAILLTVIPIAIFLIATPSARKAWRRSDLGIACALFLLASAPYIWWNATHQWAGLRLQLWDRHVTHFGFEFHKIAEYSFEQLVAATPLLLPLFLMCLFIRLPPYTYGFCLLKVQVISVLGTCLIAGAFITETHPHWTSLAYAPASIMLAAVWTAEPARRLFRHLALMILIIQLAFGAAGLAFIALPQLIVHIPSAYLEGSLGRGLVKGRQRLLGYAELCAQLAQVAHAQGLTPDTPIFTSSYQVAGPLSFARQSDPVVCLNAFLRKEKRLGHGQYYYLTLKALEGKTGLFITPATSPYIEETLDLVCEEVVALSDLEQRFAGEAIGNYRVYRVRLRER